LGGVRKFYFIERPQEERPLPVVLSGQEVARLFEVTENLKHKCLLMLIYSAGLRVSEALNMKIKDIDSQRMQLLVRNAKGGKDRVSQTGTACYQKACCHCSGSIFSCTNPRTTSLRGKAEGLILPGVRRAY